MQTLGKTYYSLCIEGEHQTNQQHCTLIWSLLHTDESHHGRLFSLSSISAMGPGEATAVERSSAGARVLVGMTGHILRIFKQPRSEQPKLAGDGTWIAFVPMWMNSTQIFQGWHVRDAYTFQKSCWEPSRMPLLLHLCPSHKLPRSSDSGPWSNYLRLPSGPASERLQLSEHPWSIIRQGHDSVGVRKWAKTRHRVSIWITVCTQIQSIRLAENNLRLLNFEFLYTSVHLTIKEKINMVFKCLQVWNLDFRYFSLGWWQK